ncbi:MAG: Rpn family recombination-promoting nuclease/putative transposase, partial [Thermoguttaceae bacterium]|nr:Rpn family recombination-promoting nuclease/putative transposase [Thermoguttaceae bacterium]
MTKDTERNENEQDDLNSTTVESKGKGKRTEKKENAENKGKEHEDSERVLSPSDHMFHAAHLSKRLAVAFVKNLFPDKVKFLQVNKLTIEASDFYSDTLKKRVADVIYTIPLRNSTKVVKVVLILEHKGQSSPSENKATLAQIFTYVGEFCRREAREAQEDSQKVSPQPIPVVVYTGSDETLEELTWSDSFGLPRCFAEYGIAFPVKFVNMTSLRLKGELPQEPFLETMYEIMTRHDAAEFDGFPRIAFRALKRIKRKWTAGEKSLARELVYFFKEQARSLRVKLEKEDVQALIQSGNLEENMEND